MHAVNRSLLISEFGRIESPTITIWGTIDRMEKNTPPQASATLLLSSNFNESKQNIRWRVEIEFFDISNPNIKLEMFGNAVYAFRLDGVRYVNISVEDYQDDVESRIDIAFLF